MNCGLIPLAKCLLVAIGSMPSKRLSREREQLLLLAATSTGPLSSRKCLKSTVIHIKANFYFDVVFYFIFATEAALGSRSAATFMVVSHGSPKSKRPTWP